MTYFTFENLSCAYLDCKKRKSNTLSCLKFTQNLEENFLELENQLQNRTYKPGRSIAFVIEKPKIREIFAADFRDRVVHHLLCNYLIPIFEKNFIFDSFACREKKGTHRAMFRLKRFVSELERESSFRHSEAQPRTSSVYVAKPKNLKRSFANAQDDRIDSRERERASRLAAARSKNIVRANEVNREQSCAVIARSRATKSQEIATPLRGSQ